MVIICKCSAKLSRLTRNQGRKGYKKSFTCSFGFYGKTKFEMTWNIVKNGTAEPEMKHFQGSSIRGWCNSKVWKYNKISKTARCGFFHFENGMRYGSIPDGLGTLGIYLTWKLGLISSWIFKYSSTVVCATSVANAMLWCWILYIAIVPPRNKNIKSFYC